MSTQTPNLNLTKPAGNERPYRSVINDNMDILDTKIGAVGNTDLQSQVTALRESVSRIIFGGNVESISFSQNNAQTACEIVMKLTGTDFVWLSMNLDTGELSFSTYINSVVKEYHYVKAQ